MGGFLADVRRAGHLFRTSPGLVLVSVLSLGLGLGVNLTLFTAVRAVFFYAPSVPDPERVVGVEPGNSNQFSYLNYRDLLESGIFETAIGYRNVQLNVRAAGEVEPGSGLAVTPNFFDVLRPAMAAGGFFHADAVPERQPRVAVLGHTFWHTRFAGRSDVVGRELVVNGEVFVVAGVVSDRYRPVVAGSEPSLYVPISRLVLPTVDDRSNGNALAVLGWLRPGMTREQAHTAVTNAGALSEQRFPVENAGMRQPAGIVPLVGREFGGRDSGPLERFVIPAILLSLFSLVLLSACANVAGLLLARTVQRQREMALRSALGGSRWRLVRMLLTESFAIAAAGAVAGTALSLVLRRLLEVIVLPGEGVVRLALATDLTLVLYALALLVITGVLCGLAPSWRVTGRDVVGPMQRGESASVTARLRTRNVFVLGQVAVCAILLVLSALMLRSVMRIAALDPGLDLDRGLVARVHVNADRYAVDGGLGLGERIVERLGGMPGVQAVGFANIVALGGDSSAARFQTESRADGSASPRTFVNSVSPGYFAALGVPVVRGRDFDGRDRQGAPPVAIVTQAFASAYFPGEDALGKRVRGGDTDPYVEIVGIVGDHKYQSYGEPASPIFYAAYAQRPQVSTQVRPLVVHLRTAAAPGPLLQDVKRAIAELDSTIATDLQVYRDAAGTEPALRRLGTRLLGSAGILALLLATMGLYGSMAFMVASRTQELGIRLALGASPGLLLARVIRRGLTLVAGGIALGLGVSLVAARAMSGVLAGLSAADPVSFAGTAVLLLFVGAAACFVPARRAARVDPVVALRRT
jgi:putative ABC transport system permease protein